MHAQELGCPHAQRCVNEARACKPWTLTCIVLASPVLKHCLVKDVSSQPALPQLLMDLVEGGLPLPVLNIRKQLVGLYEAVDVRLWGAHGPSYEICH